MVSFLTHNNALNEIGSRNKQRVQDPKEITIGLLIWVNPKYNTLNFLLPKHESGILCKGYVEDLWDTFGTHLLRYTSL